MTQQDQAAAPQEPGRLAAPMLSVAELHKRIEDFAHEYLKHKSRETVGTYRRSLNEFERWAARAQGFRFTPENVEAYKDYLMRERGLHQVSVSTYLTALRRLCQYLVEIGVLTENPAVLVKGNRRPGSHTRSLLTASEIATLLASLPSAELIEQRDVAIVHLMLYAGLSEIEVVRANVRDLEHTLMGIYLRVQGKGRTVKDQQAPLDQRVVEPLQRYLDSRGRLRPSEPLLLSHGFRSDEQRLNTRSVRNRINALLEQAGIKRRGVTPHSLTHTAALIWLNEGMDIEEVKERMRHGTLDTTMIYFRRQGLYRMEPEALANLDLSVPPGPAPGKE